MKVSPRQIKSIAIISIVGATATFFVSILGIQPPWDSIVTFGSMILTSSLLWRSLQN